MKKLLLFMAMMLCSFATINAQCVTLNMYESYGDGWSGNYMMIDGINYTVFLAHQNLMNCVTLISQVVFQ